MIEEWFAEDREALRMCHHGINHESDECPRLLAVPAPIVSPTYIRSNSSDENAESHGSKGRVEEYAT